MDLYKSGISLAKPATVNEIVNAAVFLASDLVSHNTMRDLVMDGGTHPAA